MCETFFFKKTTCLRTAHRKRCMSGHLVVTKHESSMPDFCIYDQEQWADANGLKDFCQERLTLGSIVYASVIWEHHHHHHHHHCQYQYSHLRIQWGKEVQGLTMALFPQEITSTWIRTGLESWDLCDSKANSFCTFSVCFKNLCAGLFMLQKAVLVDISEMAIKYFSP